jgi:hypothetical protein
VCGPAVIKVATSAERFYLFLSFCLVTPAREARPRAL